MSKLNFLIIINVALLSFRELSHSSYNVFILIASQTITTLDLKSHTPVFVFLNVSSPPLPTSAMLEPDLWMVVNYAAKEKTTKQLPPRLPPLPSSARLGRRAPREAEEFLLPSRTPCDYPTPK